MRSASARASPTASPGLVVEQELELHAVDLEQLGVPKRLHRRRSLRARQDRELPEHGSRPERVEDELEAVALRDDAHASGHDDVDAVARVTLEEQPVASRNGDRSRRADQLILEGGREQAQQRGSCKRRPHAHRAIVSDHEPRYESAEAESCVYQPAGGEDPCLRLAEADSGPLLLGSGLSQTPVRQPSRLMAVDLSGKTAIVTGASSGIGAATARKLREAGVRVVGGARRVERVEADLALPLDVMDEESCAAFVGRAAAELGGVDILFNNAGLALGRYPFWESNPEDEQTVLHTNVDGVLRMTRLCLPHIRDEGHILFMGSVAGRQAYQNGASYVAAKFAVRGFVYALREDLLGRPIRITTVDAGLVETEFSLVRYRGDADAAKAVYEGVDPVTPDEVADCVMFALTRPLHVNVDEIVVKALAQSSGARVVRRT